MFTTQELLTLEIALQDRINYLSALPTANTLHIEVAIARCRLLLAKIGSM